MLKVAILDDYQNISHQFVDLKKLSGKYEIKVFSEPFKNEEEAIESLKDFEALLIMRERTLISENLINSIKKLKFIITSGMRNKAIDLKATKKRKIIVSGTEINTNPTCELTWALILGLARNFKSEIRTRSSFEDGNTSNSLHLSKSKFSLHAMTCMSNAFAILAT